MLGRRVLAGMGTISYGFYLWHVPVLVFLRGHGLLPLDPVLGPLVALVPAFGRRGAELVRARAPGDPVGGAAQRARATRRAPAAQREARQAAAASTAAPAGARSAQSARRQRAPYVRMSSMIGSSARPFSVSAYSTRGGTSG